MQEQRQPVSLIAVQAVVTAQGQVETQDHHGHQPPRQAAAGRAERPPTTVGSFPSNHEGCQNASNHDLTASVPPPGPSVNLSPVPSALSVGLVSDPRSPAQRPGHQRAIGRHADQLRRQRQLRRRRRRHLQLGHAELLV